MSKSIYRHRAYLALGPLVAVVMFLSASQTSATLIRVDHNGDPYADNPGSCQLADAIRAANLDRDQGGCRGGSRVDTIVFDPDMPAVIQVLGDLPLITSDLTIEGNGVHATIIRGSQFRGARSDLIDFLAARLTLRDLTLTYGKTCLRRSYPGGESELILERVLISQCSSDEYSASAPLVFENVTGKISDLTLRNNHGSMLMNLKGSNLEFDRLTLTNNLHDGTMLFVVRSLVSLDKARIEGNEGLGPIELSAGVLRMTESLVSENEWTNGHITVRNDGALHLRETVIAANRQHFDIHFDIEGVLRSLGGNFIANNEGAEVGLPTGEPNANRDWVGSPTALLLPGEFVRTANGYLRMPN